MGEIRRVVIVGGALVDSTARGLWHAGGIVEKEWRSHVKKQLTQAPATAEPRGVEPPRMDAPSDLESAPMPMPGPFEAPMPPSVPVKAELAPHSSRPPSSAPPATDEPVTKTWQVPTTPDLWDEPTTMYPPQRDP